jgi:hypothetical protein
MQGLISRIANRVFLAFTCRRHVTEHGFGYDGADKGLSAFDFRYQLLLWAYPKGDKVKVVYAKKADNAFDYVCHGGAELRLGDVGKEIRKRFRSSPRSASSRNFKVLVWNTVMESQFSKFNDASFLVERTELLDYEKAKTLLTTKYDFSLKNFYAVFGEGQSDGNNQSGSEMRKFSCEGMNFEVNDSKLGKNEVEPLMAIVKSKLPESLSSVLLYGSVELKGSFGGSGRTIADYTYSDDTIRIDASDRFVTSMIHELGHRWHYKFCTPAQEKALGRLYRMCKVGYGNTMKYGFGDTILLEDGRTIVIVGEVGSSYKYYEVNEDGSTKNRLISKWFLHANRNRHVVSVNGQPLERYGLPRRYAGKNFREFIACCFEHAYGGLQILDNVRNEFKAIVEGGQK